jgi:hypothetical protein
MNKVTQFHTSHSHFQAMKRVTFININNLISFIDSEGFFVIYMNLKLTFYTPVFHSQTSALALDSSL